MPGDPSSPPDRWGRMSRPVRRVLCRGGVSPAAVATIHLGAVLPQPSSDLPAGSGGQPSCACCLVLLRAGFAQPHPSPGALVVSCTTVSPLPIRSRGSAVCFLLHCSRGSPRVGVTHRPALWSPDVPRQFPDAAARPTHSPCHSTRSLPARHERVRTGSGVARAVPRVRWAGRRPRVRGRRARAGRSRRTRAGRAPAARPRAACPPARSPPPS